MTDIERAVREVEARRFLASDPLPRQPEEPRPGTWAYDLMIAQRARAEREAAAREARRQAEERQRLEQQAEQRRLWEQHAPQREAARAEIARLQAEIEPLEARMLEAEMARRPLLERCQELQEVVELYTVDGRPPKRVLQIPRRRAPGEGGEHVQER